MSSRRAKRPRHERNRQSECLKIIIPVNFNNERHFTALMDFDEATSEEENPKAKKSEFFSSFSFEGFQKSNFCFGSPSSRDIPN
jgi:hypothetical protein